MTLRELFGNTYSKSAFRTIDGELRLVGKFGQVSKVDDLWDVWFICTERKLSMVEKNIVLNMGDNSDFTRLTGEGIYRTKSSELAVYLADLCGIRRKRQISDDEKKRLANMRQKLDKLEN